MTVLRDREAKALISLGTDALSEACHMGHQLHSAIYDTQASTSNPELQDTLAEVLTCMERAEHYLLMLGSNFEENTPPAHDATKAIRGRLGDRCRAWRSDSPPARPATPTPSPSPFEKEVSGVFHAISQEAAGHG